MLQCNKKIKVCGVIWNIEENGIYKPWMIA